MVTHPESVHFNVALCTFVAVLPVYGLVLCASTRKRYSESGRKTLWHHILFLASSDKIKPFRGRIRGESAKKRNRGRKKQKGSNPTRSDNDTAPLRVGQAIENIRGGCWVRQQQFSAPLPNTPSRRSAQMVTEGIGSLTEAALQHGPALQLRLCEKAAVLRLSWLVVSAATRSLISNSALVRS